MFRLINIALGMTFFLFCTGFGLEFASEIKPELKNESNEEFVETEHSIKINGETVSYKAVAGTLSLKDSQDKPKATIFYIAYTKQEREENVNRPITFCFNGGPGSSAIWLHLGVFGPKRVVMNEEGCASLPFNTEDNPETLLSVTDLVFIDPVSTGFSRAAPGEDLKQFYGYQEDVKWMAEFIRLYTSRFHRWRSPKFIAGESYGTTRAVGLAALLHDQYFMQLNGMILVSAILNFQTNHPSTGNDLPFPLFLPSYTATAWYHKKLSEDLQNRPLVDLLEEVEGFALNTYSLALLKGDLINENDRSQVIKQLSRYTGLSTNYIKQANMRICPQHFGKELLRDQQKILGRFDSRLEAFDLDGCNSAVSMDVDPSIDVIAGGYTAALNDYLYRDLKWKKNDEYKIIEEKVFPWNFGKAGDNKFLDVSGDLAKTMVKNRHLRVFVASGYYDLAIPYFATDYTFNHLGLDEHLRAHLTMEYYQGGHMMYTFQPSLIKLNQDLSHFITTTCQASEVSEEENKLEE